MLLVIPSADFVYGWPRCLVKNRLLDDQGVDRLLPVRLHHLGKKG